MTKDAVIIDLARRMQGLTRQKLAINAGIAVSTLYRFFDGDEVGETTVVKIANALKLKFDWSTGHVVQPPEIEDASIARLTKKTPAKAIKPDTQLIEVRAATEVPTWDVDVAAGAWTDVPICELDANDPKQRTIIETGRFRIRIHGDCMQPDYPSGMVIEFEIMRVDREAMQIGADYVVCKNDNTGTFKRLVALDDDAITLAAVNQAAHPGTLIVPRQEVTRVAKVAYRLYPPPEPKVPKLRKAGRK